MSLQPAGGVSQTFLDSIIPSASPTMPRVRPVTEVDLLSVPDDEDDTSTPDGYTRYTLDPSHRGEAMHHVTLRQNITREGLRRGAGRRELKKRGRGMKGRVDKSIGIVTLIAEALAKINPTVTLRVVKRAARRKRN